jgi:serine/threonine protein kinase/predicted ATPase
MSSLPRQISHFEVVSELGRGGMGIVYKVRDTRTGAHAALKMIPPEALSRPDSALRFKREFRAMLRVEHPNVIRVYEAGTHEGCPFFTMELVDGREIRKFIDGDVPIVPSDKDGPQNGLFSPEQRRRLNDPGRVKKIADLVVQVAFALAEIHSHRIVHRDLKPDNILVSKAGVAKLMDFGIAKQLSANSEHSSGGMVVGTFKYLSPEQALGSEIDGRADLYCLGIIMYELLVGRHPFYSENSVGYAFHHARKAPPDMAKFNPEIHQGLKEICEKLIKKDPVDRYATAEDVIAAIRSAVDEDQALSGAGVAETSTRQRIQGPAPVRNLPYELAKDQLFQPALVGRTAELSVLGAAGDRLRRGRGEVVVVTGRTGIGKSRLVREAAAAGTEARIAFVSGRCVEHGTPYQPFVEVVEAIIAEHNGRPQEIGRLLGDDGRVIARYVSSLQNLDGAIRPKAAAALEPRGERLRFLHSFAAFLSRTAVLTPRVVVIDDIHLADELSLGLAQHLAEHLARREVEPGAARGPPVVLVLTVDPSHPRAAGARELVARLAASSAPGGAATMLALQPLKLADVKEMLASMLGGSEVGQELAEYLHGESGGLPGAIEDRVRAWYESGELRRSSSKGHGRQWVFVKKAAVEGADRAAGSAIVGVREATRWDVPVLDFAENPHQKRVGRLSVLARDVAERLAVVGEQVGGLFVERVALRAEEEVLDALDELVKRAILSEDKTSGLYRFVDGEDRRALVAGLSRDRAQQLHHFVARALEDDARRHRRAPNPEELSSHYLEAGEPLKAIEQKMVAARNALAASATQTAAQHVREAQELLASEQKSAELKQTTVESGLVRIDLELVLLRLDVLAAVNEHKECVALARRRLPRTTGVEGRLVAELLLRLASSERLVGDIDAALEHTAEVLSRTERGGSHALRCRAKSLCGLLYEQRGEFEVAGRYFTDALELARTIGDEQEEERARWAIAQRDLAVGDLDGAARVFEQLQQAATSRGEKLRVSQYVNAVGVIAHERDQLEEAEVAFRKVIDLAKPAGDRRTIAMALHHIAAVRRDQERYEDALGLTAKASRMLMDLDQVESLAVVRVVEAQILLARALQAGHDSDRAEAAKKADEALDLAGKANSAVTVAEAALCRGLARVRQGDAAGREDIERGVRSARLLNANRPLLHALLTQAECHARAGDPGRARDLLDEARQRARRTGFRRCEAAVEALAHRLSLG